MIKNILLTFWNDSSIVVFENIKSTVAKMKYFKVKRLSMNENGISHLLIQERKFLF